MKVFYSHRVGERQFTVGKKMAEVHFITIPREPNAANRQTYKAICFFYEIYPYTNNIMYAGYGILSTFLCVMMSVFRVLW